MRARDPGDADLVRAPGRLTTVRPVLEVALLGSAEAGPWVDLLAASGLRPRVSGERVEVMLLACEARYLGRTFRELSLSVALWDGGDSTPAAYLAGAFNSVRFFAWCERVVFKTPYAYGEVALVGGDAPALRGPPVDATAGRSDLPWEPGDEGWVGVLHLPRRPGAGKADERVFVARLEGASRRRAFDARHDHLVLTSRPMDAAWATLAASGFQPLAWQVRPQAVHARSRTVRRPRRA